MQRSHHNYRICPDRIYVGNLDPSVDEREFRDFFSHHFRVEIREVNIVQTQRQTNYGFVILTTREDVERILQISRHRSCDLRERTLTINEARRRTFPKPPMTHQKTEVYRPLAEEGYNDYCRPPQEHENVVPQQQFNHLQYTQLQPQNQHPQPQFGAYQTTYWQPTDGHGQMPHRADGYGHYLNANQRTCFPPAFTLPYQCVYPYQLQMPTHSPVMAAVEAPAFPQTPPYQPYYDEYMNPPQFEGQMEAAHRPLCEHHAGYNIEPQHENVARRNQEDPDATGRAFNDGRSV